MAEPTRPRVPPAADPATERPGLPVQRAFVVQLRADADPGRGVVRGRIEHMASGAVARFESVDELVACLRDALAARPAAPSPPAAPDTPTSARRAPRRAS